MIWIFGLLGCGTPCEVTDIFGDDIDQNCDGVDGIDMDGDGIASWQSGGWDCDDLDADLGEGEWRFLDWDGDGYGNMLHSEFQCLSVDNPLFVNNADDCNDGNETIHPNAVEICDLMDNDCDALIDNADDSLEDDKQWPMYPDADGDGFGADSPAQMACFGSPNMSRNPLDCDDDNPNIAPNLADQSDDGIDQNCDGTDQGAMECPFPYCAERLSSNRFDVPFVYISVATFQMGSPENENGRDGDEVLHSVTLTHDFWMMSTEVTQQFYESIVGYNPAWLRSRENPVEMVSWHDSALFANQVTQWSNDNLGSDFEECYQCSNDQCMATSNFVECTGFRLPTEAEWEYAARAGTSKALWTDNGGGNIPNGLEGSNGCQEDWNLSDGTSINDLAWFCLNSFFVPIGHREVATTTPNSFGLFDMHGNVWEWVQDDYLPYWDEVIDPIGQDDNTSKVVRGGRWAFWSKALRSAERGNYSADNQRNEVGFRLVRSIIDNTD